MSQAARSPRCIGVQLVPIAPTFIYRGCGSRKVHMLFMWNSISTAPGWGEQSEWRRKGEGHVQFEACSSLLLTLSEQSTGSPGTAMHVRDCAKHAQWALPSTCALHIPARTCILVPRRKVYIMTLRWLLTTWSVVWHDRHVGEDCIVYLCPHMAICSTDALTHALSGALSARSAIAFNKNNMQKYFCKLWNAGVNYFRSKFISNLLTTVSKIYSDSSIQPTCWNQYMNNP